MNSTELPFTVGNRLITRERLITALIFALLAHGVILLGVGFVSLVPRPSHNRTVAVTLVRDTRVVPPPRNVDYLAQANQRGPGNTRRHDAPRPALGAGEPFTQPDLNLAAAFRAESPALQRLLQADATHPVPARHSVIGSTTGPRLAASGPAPRAGERPPLLARLVPPSQAQNADSHSPIVTLPRLHGAHPKRNADTTNTRASVYAPYLEAWRTRIEVVGNQHYSALVPAYIKHGHVTLTITLNADGSIQSVRPMRRSRYPELDAAALKMIRLAAPFPPFPPAVRKLTSRLTFTYQWNFIRGAGNEGSVGLGTQP
ncbi:MAG: energy transducer TonB [Gammaproteobacteria bacterium]